MNKIILRLLLNTTSSFEQSLFEKISAFKSHGWTVWRLVCCIGWATEWLLVRDNVGEPEAESLFHIETALISSLKVKWTAQCVHTHTHTHAHAHTHIFILIHTHRPWYTHATSPVPMTHTCEEWPNDTTGVGQTAWCALIHTCVCVCPLGSRLWFLCC